jgi:cytochrome c-type biogenesis protein CcmE
MTRRRRRGVLIASGAGILCLASLLAMTAMRDNIVFFHTPTELLSGKVTEGNHVRIGGLVEKGSLERQSSGLDIKFRITDGAQSLPVLSTGILPDLFREGQGVVAEGQYQQGAFRASTILAKHDENYMPREAAAALQSANPGTRMK